MSRASGLAIEIEPGAPAILPGVEAFLHEGVRTGASSRNWASYASEVVCGAGLPDWRRDLLTDPQTSGGLLQLAVSHGFASSRIVARVTDGPSGVQVRA